MEPSTWCLDNGRSQVPGTWLPAVLPNLYDLYNQVNFFLSKIGPKFGGASLKMGKGMCQKKGFQETLEFIKTIVGSIIYPYLQ